MGGLPAAVVEHAQSEAAYVFQSMGVGIQWTPCGAEMDAADTRMRPDFVVRVRVGGHLPKSGDTSLEAMGRAFMNEDGTGNMADVYFGAIRELTLLYPVATPDQLMGYTMAHELGHLPIGAGHRPNGLMRAALSKKELDALNHRHLKFNAAEQAAILHKLRSRWSAARNLARHTGSRSRRQQDPIAIVPLRQPQTGIAQAPDDRLKPLDSRTKP